MSRAYQIRVSETVTRVVHVEDGVQMTLDLLPVLPAERLSVLLREELLRRGFQATDEESTVVRDQNGVVVTINTKTGEVRVSAQTETTVSKTSDKDESIYRPDDSEPTPDVIAATHSRVRQGLEARINRDEAEMRREVTERLERELQGIRPEIDEITNRVTGTALEEKARQMGEIAQISRDAETGAMVIRVRL